ncbi:MAG TPA: tetratricopeptide repeat protein, partial [Trueperaceae bacterium]
MRGNWNKALGAILLLALACAALAQTPRTVAVYPFASQDVLAGVAVADRLATALASELEVLGPAVTPAFLPLLLAKDGYVPPLDLLSGSQGGQVGGRAGAALLRSLLGVDAALTGQVSFGEAGLQLDLQVADTAGVRTFEVSAPEDQPGLLAERALGLVAGRLGVALPAADTTIDLSGPYGDYVSALALLTGGFVPDARAALERALQAQNASLQQRSRWRALLDNLKALAAGKSGTLPDIQAAAALNSTPFDPAMAEHYFQALPDYPFKDVWLATLAESQGHEAQADAAFDRAARYPFGRAARAMYRTLQEDERAARDLQALQDSSDIGGLLGASLAAKQQGDVSAEKRILTRLTKTAPTFAYPFERLSFIAFDQKQPLAAGEALAVAVRLQPHNDLYWTNFGWATYLLGLYDQSEAASERALALDASQEIAWFNLGLVRAVTGRLDEAMAAYQQALNLDPDVNDDAIRDLQDALDLHPDQPSLHFALARLYEQEGRREAAAGQYASFLAQATNPGPYAQEARQRIAFLQAPPPPIAIKGGIELALGEDAPASTSFQPGDRVHASFELSTPGYELPN